MTAATKMELRRSAYVNREFLVVTFGDDLFERVYRAHPTLLGMLRRRADTPADVIADWVRDHTEELGILGATHEAHAEAIATFILGGGGLA